MCTCRLAGRGRARDQVERPEGDFGRFSTALRTVSAVILSGSTAARNRLCSILAKPTTRCCSKPCSARRYLRAKSQTGHDRQARISDRAAAARLSAPDLLLDLRLWRQRTVCQAQGLRSADSSGSGFGVNYRHDRAIARRRIGGRCFNRNERLRGDPSKRCWRGSEPEKAPNFRCSMFELDRRLDGGPADAAGSR